MSETAASPFARRHIGPSPEQQAKTRCITVLGASAELLWVSMISPKAVRADRSTKVDLPPRSAIRLDQTERGREYR
jgi:hypothetical protein